MSCSDHIEAKERERGEDGDTVRCRDGDGTEETGTERGTGRKERREGKEEGERKGVEEEKEERRWRRDREE